MSNNLIEQRQIESEIFSPTSPKAKNKRRAAKVLFSFIVILSKTPEKLSLVVAFVYHLFPDPNENFKNKNQSKIFDLAVVTSNEVNFHSL